MKPRHRTQGLVTVYNVVPVSSRHLNDARMPRSPPFVRSVLARALVQVLDKVPDYLASSFIKAAVRHTKAASQETHTVYT